MPRASGKAMIGIHTRCPPMMAMTIRIRTVNGRSIRLVRVSEARKSRRPWNS
ncbi:hypothetical protein D3C81_1117480 [compost metagenome]